MTVELSSLKIEKTCCKPEKFVKKHLQSFSNDLMKMAYF